MRLCLSSRCCWEIAVCNVHIRARSGTSPLLACMAPMDNSADIDITDVKRAFDYKELAPVFLDLFSCALREWPSCMTRTSDMGPANCAADPLSCAYETKPWLSDIDSVITFEESFFVFMTFPIFRPVSFLNDLLASTTLPPFESEAI